MTQLNPNFNEKIRDLELLQRLSDLLTITDLPIEEKLQKVVDIIADAIGVKKCSLVLYDEKDKKFKIVAAKGINLPKEKLKEIDPLKQSKIISLVVETKKPIIVKSYEDMVKLGLKPKKKYEVQSFISTPLIVSNNKFLGVINLTDPVNGKPFTIEDEKTIYILSNHLAVTVENTKLSEEVIKNKIIKEQLKLAEKIQKSLLPKNFPETKDVEFYGVSKPTFRIGGDYFDVIRLNENEIAFILADVSGKGVPASLIMTSFRSYFHAILKRYKRPETVLTKLNNLMLNDLEENSMFITCFYGIYNIKKKELIYGSAGHEPALIYKANSKKFKFLDTIDTILGAFKDYKFSSRRKKFHKNDILIVYSDGVTDLHKEINGIQLLKENVKKFADKSIKQIIKNFIKRIEKIITEHEQFDDITILGKKIKR